MLRRYVLVMLVMLPAVRLGAAEAPRRAGPIVEGTRTHTARGGGLWRNYINADGARVVCANKSFLWLAKRGSLWRYNVADRRIDVHISPLTHPELCNDAEVRMAADGRTVVSCYGSILFYDGRTWSLLPQPRGIRSRQSVIFDSRGRLWATPYSGAYRWDGKRWSLGAKIARNNGMWPLGDKWFMWNRSDHGKNWKTYSVWDAKFTTAAGYPAETDKLDLIRRGWAYQTKAGLVIVFRNCLEPYQTGPLHVGLITDKKIEEIISAKYPIVDLASGKAMALELGADGNAAKVRDTHGKEVASLPAPPGDLDKRKRALLRRDGNGDYWLDRWRCDGKVWKEILPVGAFVFDGSMRGALRTGRLCFDKSRGTWVDVWPHIPTDVIAYDPKTRTGWVPETGKLGGEPCISRKYRFSADGSRELLQTLTRPSEKFQRPLVEFEHGCDTWFLGVNRWDGRKFHHYDDGWIGRGSDKLGIPTILLSPKGGVWMHHTHRFWQRFDSKMNAFKQSDPFDEFQFNAEGGTYAIVGYPMCRTSDSASHLGGVYKKSEGIWSPLMLASYQQPRAEKSAWGSLWLKGVFGHAVRDGRMLVSCRYGVFEIDLKSGKQAYLSHLPNMVAWFDDSGLRAMASNDWHGLILTYQGDPLEQAPPRQLTDVLKRRVTALLKSMDDDSWRVRSRATDEAVNLIRKHPREVTDMLRSMKLAGNLSLEVRGRVTLVLEQSTAEDNLVRMPAEVRRAAILGNSLHERMYPKMAPPCEYAIRPGMEYEHVQAILSMFGAVFSYKPHNSTLYSVDEYHRGYILPDTTMVYICLGKGKSPGGKVLTLGLGKAGKGNNLHLLY